MASPKAIIFDMGHVLFQSKPQIDIAIPLDIWLSWLWLCSSCEGFSISMGRNRAVTWFALDLGLVPKRLDLSDIKVFIGLDYIRSQFKAAIHALLGSFEISFRNFTKVI